jgi:undecaprenyl-diphosphatase
MSLLQIAALALLQGFTEFLPVSSSGHLRVLERWFGVEAPLTTFDVILHLGTLCSVIVFFFLQQRQETLDLLRFKRPRMLAAIILGTIPTGILGLSMGRWAETNLHHPAWIALAFLATAGLLFSTRMKRATTGTRQEPRYRDALLIGLAQGVGVIRGISRSGITISAGLHLGLDRQAAFNFSFLLSIPAILGAFILEARHIDGLDMPILHLILGFAIAFASGYVALVLLKRFVLSGRFWIFGIYLIAAAALVLGLSFAGIGA